MSATLERDPPAAVVASVLEPTPEATLREIRSAPAGCAWVEIRADHLRTDELEGVIRRADRAVLVTVRRVADGGAYDGSESERGMTLRAALRAGADLVDVEWDSGLRDLAAGQAAERVVLSHHGGPCRKESLIDLCREMASSRAGRLKIVPRAERVAEVRAVRDALRTASSDSRPLACFAMGRAGIVSRVLAPSWGSWATYGSVACGRETAEGQVPARDLLSVYRVLEVGPRTKLRALIGSSVSSSPSPAMHNAAYAEQRLDQRYLVVEADEIGEVRSLIEHAVPEIDALAVTLPLKEHAAAEAEPGDDVAANSGAANTVLIDRGRWIAYNTDGPAARALIERHIGLAGARVACVGAGGTARAVAFALASAGAEVVLFNRDIVRARRAGQALGAEVRPLEALPDATWDVLVQATPLGSSGESVVPSERLEGRVVLDAVYGPRETPLVRDARHRGLAVIDGFELLVAQAVLQYRRMSGNVASADTMARAGLAWLSERRRLGA